MNAAVVSVNVDSLFSGCFLYDILLLMLFAH